MTPQTLVDIDTRCTSHMHTDVVVLGSGIAGLYTALLISERHRVVLVAKNTLSESNTRYAQGGIAAVFAADDSPLWHRNDTIEAGAGLCDARAVDVLVNEGPDAVRALIRLGTVFDTAHDGAYDLTREGAHSHRRILHAHGDATGAEIVRSLTEAVLRTPRITVWEHHFCIDVRTEHDTCVGAIIERPDGTRVAVHSQATVLCTGGCGQLYRHTTNPNIATGDGLAIAYRAGAALRDMEFVQFHPTVLTHPNAPRFLISEAVRGEGAFLRNGSGDRFVTHPLGELAPRDVVARAIVSEMQRTKSSCVYLDMTHEKAEVIRARFPSIYAQCLRVGLDMATDWIPVSPAAHYMMGGVRTNLHGETDVRRLFACGEVASTGVHGANRLASNSLSEAIVFGRRIAERIASLPPMRHRAEAAHSPSRCAPEPGHTMAMRVSLQKTMVRHVGLVRHGAGLARAQEELASLMNIGQVAHREEIELANLCTVASLVIAAARAREESRGAHYRQDFPATDHASWRRHLVHVRDSALMKEVSS